MDRLIEWGTNLANNTDLSDPKDVSSLVGMAWLAIALVYMLTRYLALPVARLSWRAVKYPFQPQPLSDFARHLVEALDGPCELVVDSYNIRCVRCGNARMRVDDGKIILQLCEPVHDKDGKLTCENWRNVVDVIDHEEAYTVRTKINETLARLLREKREGQRKEIVSLLPGPKKEAGKAEGPFDAGGEQAPSDVYMTGVVVTPIYENGTHIYNKVHQEVIVRVNAPDSDQTPTMDKDVDKAEGGTTLRTAKLIIVDDPVIDRDLTYEQKKELRRLFEKTFQDARSYGKLVVGTSSCSAELTKSLHRRWFTMPDGTIVVVPDEVPDEYIDKAAKMLWRDPELPEKAKTAYYDKDKIGDGAAGHWWEWVPGLTKDKEQEPCYRTKNDKLIFWHQGNSVRRYERPDYPI